MTATATTRTWWCFQPNRMDPSESVLPPWANTGFIDIQADGASRMLTAPNRHKCSRPGCEVSWCGAPICWVCGQPATDDWGPRGVYDLRPSYDGQRRGAGL